MHTSTLVTPGQVIDQALLFNIPIYQRLYVWKSDQIKLLLNDLATACEAEKSVYYLGGTLVIEQFTADQDVLDLIDGQQRFTTLWLLSIALQRLVRQRAGSEINHLAEFRYLMSGATRAPRIRFAIRPEVSRFFDALLNDEHEADVPAAEVLGQAIAEIEGYFNENRQLSLSSFSLFVRDRVQLVLTRVPPETDLNKLFEVINNRGVQLQHHEILKARLLQQLGDARQRETYGQLWDACSYMQDYVERNLRVATGIQLAPLFDNQRAASDDEMLAQPGHVIAALSKLYHDRDEAELALAAILNAPTAKPATSANAAPAQETYEADAVRSIISFPMLLQHVLRIFLQQRARDDIAKVLDRDLLEIFQTHWLDQLAVDNAGSEITAFVELLWRCRYAYDKHIIKWVTDNDDETHAIHRLRLNTSNGYQSLVRESEASGGAFAMLQSMLYHSQQLTTHYWLTPLLKHLVEHGGEKAHAYLKFLDNQLLCTSSDEPLIQRTRKFLDQPWYRGYPAVDFSMVLNADQGTGFSHYWFYKLEYILWETYRAGKPAWQAFRMTAKNSVEHVSPQNPKDYDSNVVSKAYLDTFGNLALVSRSLNSEYSNKPYLEKRASFLERNQSRVDSLKLATIYANHEWNDTLAIQHRDNMIEEFQQYMSKVEAAAKNF